MATYVNATARKMIPIMYKCAECGKDNLDISLVTAERSARVKIFHDTSSADASSAAKEAVSDKYLKLHEKMSKHEYGSLTCQGKCSRCGKVQPWAVGKINTFFDRHAIAVLVGLYVALLIFIIVMEGFSFETVLGGAVITFFGGGLIIMIARPISRLIANAVSLSGTAKMIESGKEYCFPKIVIQKEG